MPRPEYNQTRLLGLCILLLMKGNPIEHSCYFFSCAHMRVLSLFFQGFEFWNSGQGFAAVPSGMVARVSQSLKFSSGYSVHGSGFRIWRFRV